MFAEKRKSCHTMRKREPHQKKHLDFLTSSTSFLRSSTLFRTFAPHYHCTPHPPIRPSKHKNNSRSVEKPPTPLGRFLLGPALDLWPARQEVLPQATNHSQAPIANITSSIESELSEKCLIMVFKKIESVCRRQHASF